MNYKQKLGDAMDGVPKNYKQKLTIVLFTAILALNFYLFGIHGVLSLTFSLFFYSILTYLFVYGPFKKLKEKSNNKDYKILSIKNYKQYLNKFLYAISILIASLTAIIGGFSYYQNEISPAKMPIFTITNGDKVVVFHTMSHVGTPNFYQKVKENIKKLKSEGYVLYFEGVKPGKKENHEIFYKALGVKLDSRAYENISKLYGLVSQDNKMFLNQENNLDYNVDVDMNFVIEKYNELKGRNGNQNKTYSKPIDINDLVSDNLSKLKENELKVLTYINRSFVNLAIKSNALQSIMKEGFTDRELFKVILDERNKVVADRIISGEHKKIIAIYGLLHFDGIFELLKQNDPRWRITRIDYLCPTK